MYKHDDSQQCSIWVCDAEHIHDTNNHHLPEETKKLIRECVKDDMKNAKIIEKIRNQHLPQVTIMQLNNYKATLTNKSKTKSGLNELLEWSDNHSKIPDDMDEVFVAGYDYELDEKEVAHVKLNRLSIIKMRLNMFTQIPIQKVKLQQLLYQSKTQINLKEKSLMNMKKILYSMIYTLINSKQLHQYSLQLLLLLI